MGNYCIRIYRFNPAVDSEPRYDIYTFDFIHQPTILEVLRKIRDEWDDALAFRESCGLGKCGSCTVMINGDPVLACRMLLPEGESVIEPLSNHEVINDLVVEHSEFYERLGLVRAFHAQPDFLNDELEKYNWSKRFQNLTKCIECLACESICPAFGNIQSDFLGPAILVQLAKSLSHPKSCGNEEHVAWIGGIHNCIACMKCTYVCPKDVDPFRNGILLLRSAIKKQQLQLPKMQQDISEEIWR